MKYALIDPNHEIYVVTSWIPKSNTSPQKYEPIFSVIPNGARVADVAVNEFPVASPLFWTPFDDTNDVQIDKWYYDLEQKQLFVIPDQPEYPVQPTEGLQTP